MWNFQDTFNIRKWSFISVSSICMTVPDNLLSHNVRECLQVVGYTRSRFSNESVQGIGVRPPTIDELMEIKVANFTQKKEVKLKLAEKVFCKKGSLRNFANFTGKHMYQCLFFKKVAGLRPTTLLKKRHWHRCFPLSFTKFLRTPFLTEHLRWLLLNLIAWQ